MHSQVFLKKYVTICAGEGKGGKLLGTTTGAGQGEEHMRVLCVILPSGHLTLFQNENQFIKNKNFPD